jgi:hypothetical protein
MLGIDPLTESEMISYSGTVKLKRALTNAGEPYVVWYCTCGKKCYIAERLLDKGTEGGNCLCGRVWMIGGSKQTAFLKAIADGDGDSYKFPIIRDNHSSWRWWRKPAVGI